MQITGAVLGGETTMYLFLIGAPKKPFCLMVANGPLIASSVCAFSENMTDSSGERGEREERERREREEVWAPSSA